MSTSIQLTLRLSADQAARIDAIATAMSGPAIRASRIDAVRFVLSHGYEDAEEALGMCRKTTAKPAY